MNKIWFLISRILEIPHLFLLVISPFYSKKVTNKYWSKSTSTHSDMSDGQFDFYFNEILKIIKPIDNDLILDYGCGMGEIALRFKNAGFNIEGCDLSSSFVNTTLNKGIKCYHTNDFFQNETRYNKIYINNAFFYIHPFNRKKFLKDIFKRIQINGKLFILDEPDFNKRSKILDKFSFYLTFVFPVYQSKMGGFFNHTSKLKINAARAGFKSSQVIESWANYRSHIILDK